jgi:hypothetical protein
MPKVLMSAKVEATFSKVVEVTQAEFDEYTRLCAEVRSSRKIDEALGPMADKYRLADMIHIGDFGDMEEITLENVDD